MKLFLKKIKTALNSERERGKQYKSIFLNHKQNTNHVATVIWNRGAKPQKVAVFKSMNKKTQKKTWPL